MAMKRIRAAFRSNETQTSAVVLLTGANLLACLSRPECPLWLYIGAILFYPMIAFTANLISPIPERKSERKRS